MDRVTQKRVAKQIKMINKYIKEISDNKDISIIPDPSYTKSDENPISDIYYMKFLVHNGIYAGHEFIMKLQIRYESKNINGDTEYFIYPFNRPRCNFVGYVPYHTNVYNSGAICVSFLNYGVNSNNDQKWTPRSFAMLAQSFMVLFSDQNPNSPANPTCGRLFRDCEKIYKSKSKNLHGDDLEKCYNESFAPLIEKVNEVYQKSKKELEPYEKMFSA